MEKNYIVRIKIKTEKGIKVMRIIAVILFAITGIIMFFYSIRYFVYILVLMFILLFRLNLREKDNNMVFVDAICKLDCRDCFITLIVDSAYKNVNKIYNIQYKNFKVFNISDDGKIEIVFRDNDMLGNETIEMYILDDSINDWKNLKADIEKYKFNTVKISN